MLVALLLAAAVAVGLMVFFWSQKPAFTPLYTGLDAKATADAAGPDYVEHPGTAVVHAACSPSRQTPATASSSTPGDTA